MQGTIQASERDNMTGSGLLIMQHKKDWAFRLNPAFGGLNCDGLDNICGAEFGTKFESILGEM
jgi:hypothetical protein